MVPDGSPPPPSATFAAEWRRCRQWVLAALELTGGTHDEADLVEAIAEGRYTFWPCERSAILTHWIEYPRFRACRVFLAGGDLAELQRMEPVVAEWAKRNGCARIEICGRRGWARALGGYREVATALERRLS